MHSSLESPQGDTLCDSVGFAGHLYESGYFYMSALQVLSVIEKDLIPVRNLVYPFTFLCRVKRMNGPPGSPGCFIYKHF